MPAQVGSWSSKLQTPVVDVPAVAAEWRLLLAIAGEHPEEAGAAEPIEHPEPAIAAGWPAAHDAWASVEAIVALQLLAREDVVCSRR